MQGTVSSFLLFEIYKHYDPALYKRANNIVRCIAKQRTGKHLATEYTHATIELRMLLLVARQKSERQ
jgi:hypothetical protein